MALNELINQIVDVQIRNITSNTYSRDLNTILIIAENDVFTETELYRTYTSATEMSEDGWDTDSYAYNAVRLIFSQDITPTRVIVSKGVASTSTNLDDYLTAFNQMLMITQGWLWVISDLRDVDKQVELAGLVEVNDKMYLASTHSDDAFSNTVTTDLASRIKALQYRNTACWYDVDIKSEEDDGSGGTVIVSHANYSESALLGRCANGIAGTVNFKNKLLRGVTVPDTITSMSTVVALENKGYTFLANIEGQNYSYGSTKTGSGDWIDVILGMIWIKTNIRERVFNSIAGSEKLPYTTTGAGVIETAVRSVLVDGQTNGIVADDTPISVTTPNILELTPEQRNSRILPNVRFNARLAGSINGTVIRGEVWA